jgi:IS5 family transposase
MAMKQGTIIDATLTSAPSSTKNKTCQRYPEMHHAQKDNQWYFGMKVHIGVDKDSGLIHSVMTTSANVHDIIRAAQLLHGEEEVVWSTAMRAIKELRSVRIWRPRAQYSGLL